MPGKLKGKEKFIEEAIEAHGEGRYGYHLVVYRGVHIPVMIVCNDCGEIFEQAPDKHLGSRERKPDGSKKKKPNGCTDCGYKNRNRRKSKLTLEDFIADAIKTHGEYFDYSKVVFKTLNDRVKIGCPYHGFFWQIAGRHVKGDGCIGCSGKRKLDRNEFIRRALIAHQNDMIDYSELEYKGYTERTTFICKDHGRFEQTPKRHLKCTKGCPKCALSYYSIVAMEWIYYLIGALGIDIQHAESPEGEFLIPGTRYRADGYCKETNTIFEFNGCYFHGCPRCYNYDDKNDLMGKNMGEIYFDTIMKERKIRELGYNYVSIWECEWRQFMKDPLNNNIYREPMKPRAALKDDV